MDLGTEGTIAVFGGSGNTGRDVIASATRQGLRVKALFRPGSEPSAAPRGLEVVTGQLTKPEDVRRTLQGTDGAILVFGPRLSRKVKADVFCAAATANVIREMKALGLRRLVCQTGAMAGGDSPNWSWAVRRFVRSYRRNFAEVDADRDAQEAEVKASGLDWTVAKPFRISGAKGKGRVRAAPNLRISIFTSTRRADLADFLVAEVRNGRFLGKAIYVLS